jgi:peptide/nickel transport system substrate-binding protein
VPQRTQDLEQAMSLLKQAGQEGLTVELVTSDAVGAGAIEAAQVFAENAKGAGVTIKVKKADAGVFYGEDYLSWTFAMDFWYTRNYLAQAGQGTLPGAPYNETHWKNDVWLKIVNEAFRTVDEAKRNELIAAAEKIEYDEGGYVVWSFNNQTDAYSSKIAGLTPDKSGVPLGQFGFKDVYFV